LQVKRQKRQIEALEGTQRMMAEQLAADAELEEELKELASPTSQERRRGMSMDSIVSESLHGAVGTRRLKDFVLELSEHNARLGAQVLEFDETFQDLELTQQALEASEQEREQLLTQLTALRDPSAALAGASSAQVATLESQLKEARREADEARERFDGEILADREETKQRVGKFMQAKVVKFQELQESLDAEQAYSTKLEEQIATLQEEALARPRVAHVSALLTPRSEESSDASFPMAEHATLVLLQQRLENEREEHAKALEEEREKYCELSEYTNVLQLQVTGGSPMQAVGKRPGGVEEAAVGQPVGEVESFWDGVEAAEDGGAASSAGNV